MTSTYVKLASVTVGAGGASSIDFTSIPSTYTDLVVKYSIRTSADNITAELSLNGVKTNMTQRYLQGTGSSASSGNSTAINVMEDPSTATASTFASADLYIPNYASSNYKSISIDTVTEKNATDAYSRLVAALWSNTAAITSIGLTCAAAGNFVQYSTATLYGVTKYAETGTGSKAIGGTVTTAGGYTYHTFFSSGMFVPTTNITGAEVLCVAGGGGGSSTLGGGGGAGGLVYASSQSYTSGVNYAAIVGAGGRVGADYTNASNGTNSVFAAGTVAVGGGYGSGGGATNAGGNGGSGGGAGFNSGSYSGGTATAGQGNAGGGTGSTNNGGGGGGGAGAAGQTCGSNFAGAGGNGVNTYSAWSTATSTGSDGYYAGGGGGGARTSASTVPGTSGLGGGGFGGGNGAATSGLPNTGGGGGGGAVSLSAGGNGGSGIVIVRYTT
jgi:hypothetical protein